MTKQEKIIVSAYTGYLMCEFKDLHKYIEEALGRPVFTHELADEDVLADIREAVKPEFMALCSSFDEVHTADVRPVVLCRDCKHWHRCLSDDGKIEFFNFSRCEKGHHGFPDFFCADGERMNGDGE